MTRAILTKGLVQPKEITSVGEQAVEVQVKSRKQIVGSFANHLVPTLAAAFGYFVLGTSGLLFVFRHVIVMDDGLAGFIAFPLCAYLVFGGLFLYYRSFVNR